MILPTFILLLLGCVYSIDAQHDVKTIQKPKAQLTVGFDLGGVLLGTDSSKAAKYLKYGKVASYVLFHFKSPKQLKTILYATLAKLQPEGNYCGARDEHGDLLPGLLADYMTGAKNSETLRTIILPAILNNRSWFTSKTEQQLVYNLASLIFSSSALVETRKVFKDGLKFLRWCKQQGYRTIVLSNWDKDSVALLQQRFPEVFSLFDDVIFSGQVGCMKPDQQIFTLLKEKAQGPCIFLDDQAENIASARQAGLLAIHVESKKSLAGLRSKPNFKKVRAEFLLYRQHLAHTYACA